MMLFLGDICPDNNFRRLFDEKDSGAFRESATQYFSENDFVIANLECPATQSSRRITKTGPNIRALTGDIRVLKNCGIFNLSMANNHILDYGAEGVLETLDICGAHSINTVGAGRTKEEANKPLIVKIRDYKVAIVAFAEEEFNLATEKHPGAAHFDPYESLDSIANLKKEVDRIVVLYHGGIEYYKYPSPELQKKCRAMVTAGADLVLCQHSHCIGTIELFQNRNIVYGQGNTCFGWKNGSDFWNEGLAIEYSPEDNVIKCQLLKASEDGVDLADAECNDSRIKAIYEDSKHCYDSEFIRKEWIKFCNGLKSLNLPLLYGKSKWYTRLNRILKNHLFKLCFSKKAKMITLELIRCEAHLEVMKTILEDEIQFYTSCRKYR